MIDVRAELEEYTFLNARWAADKFSASSPFRYDRHPSFVVFLESGRWYDSGTGERGDFTELIAFLRGETIEEAAEYLAAKYGDPLPDEPDDITLTVPKLALGGGVKRTLDEEMLIPYRQRSSYLTKRGISEAVQRMMGVGYDRDRQSVVIPWRLPDATLGNVKFRRIGEKTFWYARLCPTCRTSNLSKIPDSDSYRCRMCGGEFPASETITGRPIREMIYGIDVIYRKGLRKAALVEAEIDAMSFMAAGIPAIATGGTAWSDEKRDAIVRSPIEEIVIVRDNDEAGRKWQRQVIEELSPFVNVSVASVPARHKDVNDFAVAEGVEPLRRMVERRRKFFKKIFFENVPNRETADAYIEYKAQKRKVTECLRKN